MKFVFLCDANYLKGDLVNFVNNFPTNHELVTMTSDDLLQSKSVMEGTFAILAERATCRRTSAFSATSACSRCSKCSRSASFPAAVAANPSRAVARTGTRKSTSTPPQAPRNSTCR